MKIYTSYFGAKISKDIEKIAIVRYLPRWFNGINYQTLAPSKEIFRMNDEKRFTEIFSKHLCSLNAAKIVNELRLLSGGKDIALLCYEKPGDFCHRHLVANWLKNNGFNVVEYPNSCKHEPKFEQLSLL